MSLTHEDVSERVRVFTGRHPMEGVGVTSTVVSSGKDAFVFDTLMYPDDTRNLLLGVKSMGLSPVGLINTHWHWDHTAGNQLFYETKRIISHSLSPDLMRKMTWDDFNKDLEEGDKIRTVYPNETIKDKSVLTLGDLEVEFLHTPGHTPDSIVAHLKNERVIVAGDTVMELPYLWFGDSLTLIDSLRSLKSTSAGKVIVQGHGGLCSSEKLDSDIRYVESARKRVAECIGSGKTPKELVPLIPLSECLPSERFERMPVAYGEFHSGNLEKLCGELTRSG